MLGMIWAQGHGSAIGVNGQMPWHVPEDLAFFKRVTRGHPVLMGRRTWESLDPRFRPLPGRRNIVISRDRTYDAPGAHVVSSLADAVAISEEPAAPHTESPGTHEPSAASTSHDKPLAFVMGGAQIYAEALPLADFAVVTLLDIDVPRADAFAPDIPAGWTVAASDRLTGWNISASGIPYRFVVYARPGFILPESLNLLG